MFSERGCKTLRDDEPGLLFFPTKKIQIHCLRRQEKIVVFAYRNNLELNTQGGGGRCDLKAPLCGLLASRNFSLASCEHVFQHSLKKKKKKKAEENCPIHQLWSQIITK